MESRSGRSIDIIIPIYNAFEQLQQCLASIYEHTDLEKNRLILMNDNSTDGRVEEYLKRQRTDHVVVFHNRQNQGFSANVNIGIAQSETSDVILLNSDTVVTENWVEKMAACAYSDASIGTVTPLSNHATLCSVPKFCEENALLEDMDICQTAAIVEACSLVKYPRITVANGFCMFIKREVVRLIGGFDAKTFERGYGEENDFCFRAEQMGYIHVMCDNTYIYHSGTKSFASAEKQQYMRRHEKILYERYPIQMKRNMEYCMMNPNGWVGRNIEMALHVLNGRRNILYLLQSDFQPDTDDYAGGTQLHVKHLCQQLKKDNNIIVAARNGSFLQVTAYTNDDSYSFRYLIGEKSSFPVIHDRKLAGLFKKLLKVFSIDLVHVHHVFSTSFDIFFEAHKLGIPVYYTLHDFYCLCPNEKLFHAADGYCQAKPGMKCRGCLEKKSGIYEGELFVQYWREKTKEVFGVCSKLIVPSYSAKDLISAYFPDDADKMAVLGHGMDPCDARMPADAQVSACEEMGWEIEKTERNAPCVKLTGRVWFTGYAVNQFKIIMHVKDTKGKQCELPVHYERGMAVPKQELRFDCYLPNGLFSDGDLYIRPYVTANGMFFTTKKDPYVVRNIHFGAKEKFKVAFIGGINQEKGGQIITDLVKHKGGGIEWYLFGEIGYPPLAALSRHNLVKTGYYMQEDIGSLLKHHDIDAVCILSVWPETFSYTLSEAVQQGLPVIVSKLGALGERVEAGGYGVSVDLYARDACCQIRKILEGWMLDPDSYQAYRDKAEQFVHKSIHEMADEYRALYSSVSPGGIRDSSPEERCSIYEGYILTGQSGNDRPQELRERIRRLEKQLSIVESSMTFRLARRLAKIPVPFKEKLREWLVKKTKMLRRA